MKKCINFSFSCFLQLLRDIIIMSTAFIAVLVLYKIFLIVYTETTLAACMNIFTERKNLQFILTALFGLVTLYVASKQLKKRNDTACINSLIELRKQLTMGENRNVHFSLSLEEDKKAMDGSQMPVGYDKRLEEYGIKPFDKIPMIDVYNYLGTIGLGIQMVKKDLIDMDTFCKHIGYRIENIFEGKSQAHEIVCKHIEDNKSYYPNLRCMYKKMQNRACR